MGFCFEKLGIPERTKKPRGNGWTILVDGLDSGFYGLKNTEDLIQTAGPYVDWVKQGWLIPTLLPQEFVQKKNELLRQNQIQTFPGGMLLEVAFAKNKLRECLNEIIRLKFDAVEVSDSVTELSVRQKVEMIQQALPLGLTVIAEVGKKGKSLTKDLIDEAQQLLAAGATKVIVESEGVEGIMAGEQGEEVYEILRAITKAVGQDKVIFEVPYGYSFPQINPVVSWFVKNFGPDVNLANVEPHHILAVETVRRRLCFGDIFQIS